MPCNPPLFSAIDDVLLCLYYLYNKSPKKCRQLEDSIVELKPCLEPSEIPTSKRGSHPLCACGTRSVAHKVAVLERIFGAYLAHTLAGMEDSSVKSADRQKIKGYTLKWRDSKILLGCALFHDHLKPYSILCKVLQEDEICVVRAIEAVIKTKKSLETCQIQSQYPELLTHAITISATNGWEQSESTVCSY